MSAGEAPETLIDPQADVSVSFQCRALGVPRSSWYASKDKPAGGERVFSEREEILMGEIDQIHTRMPYLGARTISAKLKELGYIKCGRSVVERLMGLMGIRASYRGVKTSVSCKAHPKIPYLLRGMSFLYPNQVWSTDITYIPLGTTHVYLSAIIDLHSRFIVGWRLHDTLEAVEAVITMKSAFSAHGIPSIVNTDQGSTYTAGEFTQLLASHKVRHSMDGKGRWADNIWIERWFRSLKNDQLYLYEYSNIRELETLIRDYVDEYNFDRPHQTLGYATPANCYYSGLNETSMLKAA